MNTEQSQYKSVIFRTFAKLSIYNAALFSKFTTVKENKYGLYIHKIGKDR